MFNPLDKILKRSKNTKSVLILWNRGLGDVPLGLDALCFRIRQYYPDCSITFLTRQDLSLVFQMLDNVETLVSPKCIRGKEVNISEALLDLGKKIEDYDLILEKPNPTKWLKWQLNKFVPKLKWNSEWDALSSKYGLDPSKKYLGVHVSTETGQYYRYEKNWSEKKWEEFFQTVPDENIILFGMEKSPVYKGKNIIDLRGETSVFEMLSLIKNYCRTLLAPDSGVLCLAYYLNESFPLKLVSIWSDPKQGILRQGVLSPNNQLTHFPIVGKKGDLNRISIETVREKLF